MADPALSRPRLVLGLGLAALCGFVALSWEIVWVRVYSFVARGLPHSFGFLLGFYLAGLAAGSLASLLFQDRRDAAHRRHLAALAGFVLLANLAGFLTVPAVAWIVQRWPIFHAFPAVAAASALMGATFPLICHFAVAADDRAGARLSYLYLANIAGSAAGSLVTGFVLLDLLTLVQVSLLLGLAGVALSASLLLAGGGTWGGAVPHPRHEGGTWGGAVPPPRHGGARGRGLALRAAPMALAALAMLVLARPLFHEVWEKLQRRRDYRPGDPFVHVVETRGAVVTVDRAGMIYGGGAYDGFFGVDLKVWPWLARPYALSALHPAPRRVLAIGLSAGSWCTILAANPAVERLTVVEIERGYLRLLPSYPVVAGLLSDPKVRIVIDDGRQWLARHPELRFDAVVCNTTHHWRGFATNLLSAEFLELVRRHLAPGGVYLYNTTSSPDVQRTAALRFPFALRVLNCMAVSDSPLVFDRERWRRTLLAYRWEGRPLFDLARAEDRRKLDHLLALADTLDAPGLPAGEHWRLESRDSVLARTRGAREVRDDNMVPEWRTPWWNWFLR